MQELEGTEALRALQCERFLSSSPPLLLPLVLTQSPTEYSLPGLSAPAAAPAASGINDGYVPFKISQNLRSSTSPTREDKFGGTAGVEAFASNAPLADHDRAELPNTKQTIVTGNADCVRSCCADVVEVGG